MDTEKPAVWPGFWARLGAWIIDLVLVAAVCFGIGWLAMDLVSSLGPKGRLIGLAIGVAYFGVTASGFGGGQSLGMRLLGLKVVSVSGRPLGMVVALARAALLITPVILNGLMLNVPSTLWALVLGALLITAMAGLSLAQVYLLIFNRPTRRLVHDLVFGSVMVRAKVTEFEVPPGRRHAVVAAAIPVAILAIFIALLVAPTPWKPNLGAASGKLFPVIDAVNAIPGVSGAAVRDNTTTFYPTEGTPTVNRNLVVSGRVGVWPEEPDGVLARIGAATVGVYEFAPDQGLTVILVRGFDLGFATYSWGESRAYSTTCVAADVTCLKP
ncbi:MAG: RDD family protein [Phenylobacterium sp.]|uniref:RDD family protein n=1 Tax=Phenylobacterium sp. TaxID=1871053 RepID=UPI002724827E|nr:RDD family protein [Phenylobacterium sp.]MDO8900577.1 RDD family protein [Phenylobacterium sp.]